MAGIALGAGDFHAIPAFTDFIIRDTCVII